MSSDEVKVCTKCEEPKPLVAFAKDATRKDGRHPWCRACNRTYQRERHAADPDRRFAGTLMERYGITLEEYQAISEAQGGLCAVCRKPNSQRNHHSGGSRRLHVDHDHETGVVRGLLCHPCNIVLGLVADDPDRLRELADYLEVERESVRSQGR